MKVNSHVHACSQLKQKLVHKNKTEWVYRKGEEYGRRGSYISLWMRIENGYMCVCIINIINIINMIIINNINNIINIINIIHLFICMSLSINFIVLVIVVIMIVVGVVIIIIINNNIYSNDSIINNNDNSGATNCMVSDRVVR